MNIVDKVYDFPPFFDFIRLINTSIPIIISGSMTTRRWTPLQWAMRVSPFLSLPSPTLPSIVTRSCTWRRLYGLFCLLKACRRMEISQRQILSSREWRMTSPMMILTTDCFSLEDCSVLSLFLLYSLVLCTITLSLLFNTVINARCFVRSTFSHTLSPFWI